MTTTVAEHKRISYFAISMAFLAWMAVKLPMPALPTLGHYFNASNQIFKISVTLNLLGFSISQIIWGPLSDRFGRCVILIAAYVLAITGTLLAMLSVNIEMYLMGRLLEGFAVGSAAPIGRAIMADKLDKTELTKVYAKYAIAALLPPAVGPVIGGYILLYLGWRYIFAFFLILATAYLITLLLYFQNTNKASPNTKTLPYVRSSIARISQSAYFWRYVLTYALINGFMITYYAAMPYWFVVHFKMAEQDYAWMAFLPIATYILGSSIASRLLTRFSTDQLLQYGMLLALSSAIVLLLSAGLIKPSVIAINIFICIFSIASGIITPMTNASLMHAFRSEVTVLSALMSGLRVGGAGLLVLITSNISLQNFWPLGIYSTTIALLALLSYRFFSKKSATGNIMTD